MTAVTGKDLLLLCQQPGPRLRVLVHVILILLLAYNLAQLSWRLLPQTDPQALLPVAALVSKSVPGGSGSGLVQQLPGWHLFGEVIQPLAEPQPVDLPETNLKLTLRGLIASPNQNEARAIVADPSGKENFYKVGDKLPGNVELKEIHADRIVIQRGGRYETLKLPKESLDMGVVSVAPELEAASLRQTTSATTAAPRQSYSLRQYRDTLLNDPQKVADLVRIQPASENGRFVGYKLQPGRDATFLARHGLLPGDVVTSVNGVELDSPAKGFGLIKDLSSAETLDLVVDRNGVKQRFTLPVN